MSLKILFVVDSLFPLGPALPLRSLTQGLVNEGYEVHIAALNEPRDTNYVSQHPAVSIHGLYKGNVRFFRQPILARRIQKLIERLQPDIVHGWCEPATSITGLAMRPDSRIRLICTELGRQFEKPVLQWLFEDKVHRKPDRMIVPHVTLQKHLEQIGVDEVDYEIIPNGVSQLSLTTAAARKRLVEKMGIPANSIIAVAAAPLQARFRLKDLIWAADLLVCVRDDVHFMLFGSGPQEWRLKKFLSQTEATGHIHFMGDDPLADELCLGADVFWQSHLRSPVSANLMHAMVHAIPVVGVYGSGMEELLVSQTTGLATNFGARDEFARWTKYLIEQTDSAEQLSRQGQQHVLENFSADQMVSSYVAVYNS